jgi:dihydrodipicolinate synthase/N-acetylneuraminate lyase
MATKNPRVVGYVSPENHAQLKEFVEQQELTESRAIDNILSQFFSAASEPESSRPSSILKEVLNRVTVLEQQMAEVMGESLA